MRRTIISIIFILISAFVCVGQGSKKYTPIKEVLQSDYYKDFWIKAHFAGINDSVEKSLSFFVKENDIIIPIFLDLKDSGAEERSLVENLKEGDVLEIKGAVYNIPVNGGWNKGLLGLAVSKAEEEAIPFQLVEVKPRFNGGDANVFSEWVNSHLEYPKSAKENGIQGRVMLHFTVEKDGSVSNVEVIRGIEDSLDKEAIRVISSSPKWEPGSQRGSLVRVTYTFPVVFQIR